MLPWKGSSFIVFSKKLLEEAEEEENPFLEGINCELFELNFTSDLHVHRGWL
jgi:hypothetical protein